ACTAMNVTVLQVITAIHHDAPLATPTDLGRSEDTEYVTSIEQHRTATNILADQHRPKNLLFCNALVDKLDQAAQDLAVEQRENTGANLGQAGQPHLKNLAA